MITILLTIVTFFVVAKNIIYNMYEATYSHERKDLNLIESTTLTITIVFWLYELGLLLGGVNESLQN